MSGEKQKIDFAEVYDSKSGVSISGGERLRFAKQVLVGIGIVCVGVFVGFALQPDNKALAAMFELVKIGALPLVTLVISFYFPKAV